MSNIIASEIKRARQLRGLTQGQLGELARIPRVTIVRMENENYSGYTYKMLVKIARALDMKVIYKMHPLNPQTAGE